MAKEQLGIVSIIASCSTYKEPPLTYLHYIELSKIHNSLKIELAIDAAIYKLRKVLLGESPQIPTSEITTAGGSPPIIFSVTSPFLLTPSCSSSYLSSKTNPSQSPSLDGEDESVDDDEEVVSSPGFYFDTPGDTTIPATPLWQTEYFSSHQAMYLVNPQQGLDMKRSLSSTSKPSLLPHDISRRGSNVSIRDISPSTSMTRFERRKQVTSAQFFIAPEFDWEPMSNNSKNHNNNSNINVVVNKTTANDDQISTSILKAKAIGVKKRTISREASANRKNLSVLIPSRQKKQ